MSNISSTDTLPAKTMRWIARVLTILWLFPVLYWTGFIVALYSLSQSEKVRIITLGITLLLFAVAALVASAWRKEALGGGVLLAANLLTIIFATLERNYPLMIGVHHSILVWHPGEFLIYCLPISTMVLPALFAGVLFLVSHRRSKTEESKLERSPGLGNWGEGLHWVAITLGTWLALLFLAATGPEIISTIKGEPPKYPPGREWEGTLMAWVCLTYFVGYVVGWYRPLWGGAFIVLSGLLFSYPQIVLGGHFIVVPLSIIGTGTLYVISHVVEKRQSVVSPI